MRTYLKVKVRHAVSVAHTLLVMAENDSDLPTWSEVCKLVLLLQPSSAAAERVFSILSSICSTSQESSLEDYVQVSVMLQYNHRH